MVSLNAIKSFLFLIVFVLFSCSKKKNIQLSGETQGTTYSIILPDGNTEVEQKQIDSLLLAFDFSLSTYNESSTLSQLNRAGKEFKIPIEDRFFIPCYQLSKTIAKRTNSSFDPSVFPLVEAWGFFKPKAELPTKQAIDSILKFTGFLNDQLHSLKPEKRLFTKKDVRFNLDFNAIAQGYSVDVVADYLDQLNVKNYFVEIGGEIKVKGRNNEGKDWRIGIDKPIDNPKDGTRELIQVINLTNCALATSGNYRKFYIKEGKKYAHTLNPISGYPAENDLLSATVITNSTAEADALATSFMVMGLEETKSWLRQNPQIRAYLVYTNAEGKHEIFKTKGLKLN